MKAFSIYTFTLSWSVCLSFLSISVDSLMWGIDVSMIPSDLLYSIAQPLLGAVSSLQGGSFPWFNKGKFTELSKGNWVSWPETGFGINPVIEPGNLADELAIVATDSVDGNPGTKPLINPCDFLQHECALRLEFHRKRRWHLGHTQRGSACFLWCCFSVIREGNSLSHVVHWYDDCEVAEK